MKSYSFDELPTAVAHLHEKLDNIEQLILSNSESCTKETVDLLNIKQAAELLSISKNTIYSLVQRAEIPVCKRGKRLYFSKIEILRWISSGRKPTKSEIHQTSLEAFIGIKRRGLK